MVLAGDFFLNVSIKSNSEAEGKAQQLTFVAQTLGAEADWGLRKIFITEICRLYNLDSMLTALQSYEPQPDPVQQELQQMEVELKKAQIDLLRAQAQEAGAKGMLNQSKVPVEAARANNIQNDADKKTLDFAEQEAGIQHNREVELEASKQANQRDIADRNNASKAITDSLKLAAATQRKGNAE